MNEDETKFEGERTHVKRHGEITAQMGRITRLLAERAQKLEAGAEGVMQPELDGAPSTVLSIGNGSEITITEGQYSDFARVRTQGWNDSGERVVHTAEAPPLCICKN